MEVKLRLVQAEVDQATHKALRLYAAAKDMSLKSVAADALRHFVDSVITPNNPATTAPEGSKQ